MTAKRQLSIEQGINLYITHFILSMKERKQEKDGYEDDDGDGDDDDDDESDVK